MQLMHFGQLWLSLGLPDRGGRGFIPRTPRRDVSVPLLNPISKAEYNKMHIIQCFIIIIIIIIIIITNIIIIIK